MKKRIKLLHNLLFTCTERSRKTNPKPGFQSLLNLFWENGRVSPGPGFFKTRVSVPNCIMATETGCEQMNVFFLWYRLFHIVLDILVVVIVL